MALCKTDLAKLKADPAYEDALIKSYNRYMDARRTMISKLDVRRDKAREKYEAELATIEARETALDDVLKTNRYHREQKIWEAAVNRLGLTQYDLLDDENLAR